MITSVVGEILEIEFEYKGNTVVLRDFRDASLLIEEQAEKIVDDFKDANS